MSHILYLNISAVTDLASLQIRKEVLSSFPVLNEELMECQGKQVFDPSDDLQLNSASRSDKRVFNSCDKVFGRSAPKGR